ncbi:MAG: ATP-binding protein [Candidatus Paceibacterota bacterium]
MNPCYIFVTSLNINQVILANYAHIVPIVLSILLALFVFFKAKSNLFSKIFLLFVITFSLWLIGDLICWTFYNYSLIYASWAPLDLIEIVFYTLGLYFVLVFTNGKDISVFKKVLLFLLIVPAFIITITKQSVLGFNRSQCEAFGNDSLSFYKLIVEGILLLVMLFQIIIPFIKKLSWKEKKPRLILIGSMFLFLLVFGVTEYLAATTAYYEINLYSLFLLPVLLVAIIYSVFELDIFGFHMLGTHYLVVGLVILMGGQLFFVNGVTDQLLSILTVVITIGLSIILFRNLKRESDQRVHIEELNVKLETLLRQRESLVHLITHKVKGSFTRSKYIFAEMIEGSFGVLSPELKGMANKGLRSDNEGIETVDLVLNAANLQTGTVKYDMKTLDFKEIVMHMINEKKGQAETKGIKFETEIDDDAYMISGDKFWLMEVAHNLIDNAVRYTPAGTITVGLKKVPPSGKENKNKILFYVKDTGIGITDEDKKNLFKEGGRGRDSIKVNVDSTGYGLYTVKLVVDQHNGKVWAESEGEGKGASFFVELDAE